MSAKKVLEVEKATRWMHPFDDGKVYCIHCGDEIELGQEFVWRPERDHMVFTCHAACAVKDGFRLSWPSTTEPMLTVDPTP